MAISDEKAALRMRYRAERHERFEEADYSFLLERSEFENAHTIASYISYGDEPSTRALNAAILKAGKELLLPRINGDEMKWIAWSGDEASLEPRSKFLEPRDGVSRSASDIDLVIVPALLVDRRGVRLGQGGGYYDRALGAIKGWKVALIHSHEIYSQDLPSESFDQRVDAIATPSIVVRCEEK